MNSEDYRLQAKEALKKILGRYTAVYHAPKADIDSDIDYFVNFTIEAAKQAVKEDMEKTAVKIGVELS